MQKTRVAIVGLGLPGLYHAHGVIQSGEGILEAVCELNDERQKEFASRFAKTFELELPQVRAVRDVDQVLADPRIDAVVVALPNALHYRSHSKPCNTINMSCAKNRQPLTLNKCGTCSGKPRNGD